MLLVTAPVRPAGLAAAESLRIEAGEPAGPAEWSFALRGIRMDGKRAPHGGETVRLPDGTPIGVVTSGAMVPTGDGALALARIDREIADETALEVLFGAEARPGRLAALPFFRDGSAGRPLV